jgi:TolB-like protein
MALVFRNNSEEPARCALEIAQALKAHPEIGVRMGVHSGPVSDVTDVNERTNIAGAGINIAQRVMDCGDAGHILLSKRVAEDLEQYEQWRSQLYDLGECEVKHGVRVNVVNLYRDDAGNPNMPRKFRAVRQKRNRKRWTGLAAALLLLLALAAAFFFLRKPGPAATGPQAIHSIAVLPLDNYSGDPSQDYFAEGMTDELTTDLATISQLRVISRSSTTQFAGAHRPPTPEIGKLLNVDAIVEGSVRRLGDKLRISAQRIDARADRHLWTKTFEGTSSDVLALQDQLARPSPARSMCS